jgi:arginine:ornithine antiporter/lysine permease
MLITVFVFVGIEGASIYSRYAKNPDDVGTATVLGFAGVLALLVLVTMLSYGILARPELASLRNPSMAGVLQAIVGPWGAVFISVGLIVSVSGAFLSWSLLAAEVLYSAAHTGTMPRFLARENARKVPANAVLLTNIVIQAFLISTLFSQDAFTAALKMTSAMILIPYLLVAAYALKLAWTGETYAAQPRSRRVDVARGAFTTLYVLGMVYAGGLKFVLLSALIYAPGVVLFVIAQREQNRRLFGFSELVVFGAAVVAALVAIWGLYSGSISL